MSNRLASRLMQLESANDAAEVGPARVREALRRRHESGVLPISPKLRQVVLEIEAAIIEMRASMNWYPDEAVSAKETP